VKSDVFVIAVIGPGRSSILRYSQTRSSSAAGGFLCKVAKGNLIREVVADIWVGWPFAGTNTAIRDDRGARSRFDVCHRAFALAPVDNTSHFYFAMVGILRRALRLRSDVEW
jgi:hypothetical protein